MNAVRLGRLFLLFLVFFGAEISVAGPGITYQGRILKPDGSALESSSVQFLLQIRSPGSENCLMYEETQTKNMASSSGIFAITLNDGTGTRSDTPTYNIDRIFSNRSVLTFDTTRCSSGSTYTPASGDKRKLIVYFKDATMSTYEPMPIMNINYVPMAMSAVESEQVGAFSSSTLLRAVDGSGNPTTAPALTPAQLTEFNALIGGSSTKYVPSATTAGATAPSYTTVAPPSTPVAGSFWFDSTSLQLKYYDGSAVQTLGNAAGSSPTGAAGGDLTGTYPNPTLATITTAGKVSGSAITSGTIAGSTAVNTSGNITTTGTVTAQNLSATSTNTRTLTLTNAGSQSLTLQPPASITGTPTFTWPGGIGSANQVLTTDGTTGALSWTTMTGAPSGTAGGDLGGTYPNPSVDKIKGTAVSATTPTTSGQVLRFNGTTWVPNFVAMTDIRSTVTGTTAFASSGCAANETLSWNSVGDVLTCQAIASLPASAISSGTIATARLGSGTADATTYLRGDNTWVTAPADATKLPLAGGTMTGVILLPAGNVSAPSLGYSADTNTGIYFNTAEINMTIDGANRFSVKNTLMETPNTVQFSSTSGTGYGVGASSEFNIFTSSSTRMTIDNSGKVGIGTASPNAKLQVGTGGASTNSWPAQFLISDSTGGYAGLTVRYQASGEEGYIFVDPTDGMSTGTLGNTDLNFRTNDTKRMTIQKTTGNVGIGTSSPGYPVEISKANPTDGYILNLKNSDASSNTGSWMRMESAYPGTGVWAIGIDDTGYALWDSTNSKVRFHVSGDGNTGVGTATPAGILHAQSAAAANNVYLETTHATSNASGLIFRARGADKWAIGNDWSENGTQDFTIYDNVAAATRFFINSSGNVTIGGVVYAPQFSGASGSNLTISSRSGRNVIIDGDDSGTGYVFMYDKVGIGVDANNALTSLLHVGDSNTTAGTTVARFETATGICTMTPATSGTGIACSSDERLKRNIASVPTNFALDKIVQLQAKTYEFKKDNSGKRYTGYIAQELQKIAPEFVREDESGFLQIYYDGLIPWITESIKALHYHLSNIDQEKQILNHKIEALQKENNELKAQFQKENAEIKNQLKKLEDLLNKKSISK